MNKLPELAAELVARSSTRLLLPEHRQIELYTRKKTLAVSTAEAGLPETARVAAACTACLLLQATFEADDPAQEGRTTWDIYRALPRASSGDRAVAEIFRILRIVRKVALHREGTVVAEGGLLRFFGAIDGTVLALDISPAGLALLESAVTWYLDSFALPYSAAYVEAMLLRYFADIVDEVKRFSDEGRSLFQFREPLRLNRHLRLDCDTVRVRIAGDVCQFEIGEAHRDAARFPIDFFVLIRDVLHIIPVEALTGGAIALAELPRWRARGIEGNALPASFRMRFAHEIMPTDVPMT
jgi:hypothetical protein